MEGGRDWRWEKERSWIFQAFAIEFCTTGLFVSLHMHGQVESQTDPSTIEIGLDIR